MTERRFTSIHSFWLRGRHIIAVALDEDVEDFTPWLGHPCRIDAFEYMVKGVEHFAHAPPWRKGEVVGIYVEEIE